MKDAYLVCIITHGDLACALKAAAEKLAIPTTELFCFSNQEKTLEKIEAEITALVQRRRPQKILILVDLVGGSCWFSANRLKRNYSDIALIGGVNIPMLVSFFTNARRLDWPGLLEKITTDAKKGIVRA